MSASPSLDEDIAAVRADIENNERCLHGGVSNDQLLRLLRLRLLILRILRILAYLETLEGKLKALEPFFTSEEAE